MSLKGKIIIASLDKKNITVLSNTLAPLNYEIVIHKDLSKLEGKVKEEKPDLIIFDADTLEGDSYEISKIIKSDICPNLPIVLMASSPLDEGLRRLLLDSKINEYLRKPVSYALLVDKIKKLLLVENSLNASIFDDGREFNFSGSLSQIPLPRILYYLKRDARTGVLSIVRDNIKKVISIEQGDPKFIVSNIVQECLGRLLVAKGRLTEDECEQSLKLMREWKSKQGETLIKMGLIEPFELDETLKMQARERLLEALGWQSGEYRFLSKKFLREDLTPVDIEIPQIVLLGVRRYYTLDILKRYLDKWLNSVPYLNKTSIFRIEDFKLATWDAKTVRFFDGKKSFRGIIEERMVREIDVYHLVFSFFSLSVLKFKEPEVHKKHEEEDSATLEISKTKALNSFQLLNVDYNADDELIMKKFDSLLVKYTTERIKSSPDKAPKIDESIKILKEAFDSIKDRLSRLQYLKKLFLEEGVLTKETSEVITSAEILSRGNGYIVKKEYAKAHLLFLNGINVFPNVGLLYSYLGYSLFLSIGKDKTKEIELLKDAQRYLKKGVILANEEEESHLLYGKLLKYIGREEEARREMKRTLAINPENVEANQEIRLLNIRGRKKQQTSFIRWKK